MYSLLPGIILRTPLLPIGEGYSETTIINFFKSTTGQECLYLASGNLLMIFNKEVQTEGGLSRKLLETLYKYYIRLTNRTTPFGTFAALSRADWGAQTKIKVPYGYNSLSKKTKLDSTITTSLIDKLKEFETYRESVTVKPNTSLYHSGSELRYIQYSTDLSGSRSHSLSASTAEDALLAVVEYAQNGIQLSAIIEAFIEQGFPEDVAKKYVNNLLDEQILISTDELITFGEDRFHSVIAELRAKGALKKTADQSSLKQIDDVCIGTSELSKDTPASIQDYLNIENSIKGVLNDKSFSTFFQVDSYKKLEHKLLENSIKKRIENVLPVMDLISQNAQYERLDTFKESFSKRYEGSFVPLLEVLDAESGISYGITTLPDDNELTRDLFFGQPDMQQNITLTPLDQWKLRLLLKHDVNDTLTLDEDSLKDLKPCDHRLSPTYSVTFRVLENKTLFIDSVGNATASCMYGRFTDLHPCIKELADQVASVEDDKYSKANGIVAEVVYLPEGKIGNVTQRSAFRKYALPYLGEANSDEIVDVANLVVSVINDEIVLFDTVRKTRVFPKMSNAHNYSMKSQPVYIFLCDLQYQNTQNYLGFNWGGIERHFDTLPRVMYKNCILRRKQWNIISTVQQRKKLKAGQLTVHSIMERYDIPQKFVIAEGDNELTIDLDDHVMASIFKGYLEKSGSILLFEYIPFFNSIASTSGDKVYANQFVASGTHTAAISTSVTDLSSIHEKIKQINHNSFSPFSDWIYLKLYMGVKAANEYISNNLKVITDKLHANNLIDNWFFIRYTDPDFHLRVRFRAANGSSAADIYNYLHDNRETLTPPFLTSVVIDTYRREAARYRYIDYELSEQIFEINSNVVVELLNLKSTLPDWMLCMYAIDSLFEGFSLPLLQKLKVINTMKAMWSKEFQVDKYSRKPVQKKFQAQRKYIERQMHLLTDNNSGQQETIVFSEMQNTIKSIASSTATKLSEQESVEFLSSHVHMICNRILPTHARKNELVIYYMLSEYYSGLRFKSEK